MAVALADGPQPRDARAWARALRAGTIAGERSPERLRPTPGAEVPFEVDMAALVQDSEQQEPDASAIERLRLLAERADAGPLGPFAATAAACADARMALRTDAAPDRLRDMLARSAAALHTVGDVPEAPIAEAAALAELAALDAQGRVDRISAAREALGRLQSPGLRLQRIVAPGALFGLPIDAGTLLLVDASTALGPCAAAIDAVVKRSASAGAEASVTRLAGSGGDGDVLRQAVQDAVAPDSTGKPTRIVVILGALVGRRDVASRVLGDQLGRGGVPVHVVVLQDDSMALPSNPGAAVELASRSGGSLRTVSRADLADAAAMSWEACARLWGQWSPMLDRQRAIVELSLGLLEGGDEPINVPREALAPLSPDPVLAKAEDGAGHDWRALLLAAAATARSAPAPAGDLLMRAARAALDAARSASASGAEPSAAVLREVAARALLLRAMLPGASDAEDPVGELRALLGECGIPDGSWSSTLAHATSGWVSAFRAERSAAVAGAEGALRAWELAAVLHLLGSEGPPPSRTPPVGLPAWEASIFSVALDQNRRPRTSP